MTHFSAIKKWLDVSTNSLLPGSIPSVLGESIGAIILSPWIIMSLK